ncbi:hypothetical protein FRC18_009649 [Serendipita sp. 400]|nr:hypothetical protein FRC18_009649 [Serendipita sp. 400]
MSDPTSSTVVAHRRLIRPLPAPGASKRVRKKPANQEESDSKNQEGTETSKNDDISTPKAPVKDLPEPNTPKQVPSLKLNDEPLPEPEDKNKPAMIDTAKDEELRKKLMGMRIYEQSKPMVRSLVIPKRVQENPLQGERRMAKVKATLKTAPKPQISFGETVTAFGPIQGKCKVKGREHPYIMFHIEPETKLPSEEGNLGTPQNTDDDPKEDDGDPAAFKAIYRRQQRQKKERLGLVKDKTVLPAFPPPDPSLSLEERLERSLQLSKASASNTEEGDNEDTNAKQLEAREKIKKLTYLMAKDIQLKRIPKSQLKAMAKGKTEQETAARMKILEMAMKIARKQQDKDKEKAKISKVSGGANQAEGEKTHEISKSTDSVAVASESTKNAPRRDSKGKDRAPGWSTLNEEPRNDSCDT